MTYSFEPIIPDQSQIEQLYELLKQRQYRISHKALPSFDEHEAFVSAHPYRAWFIVRKNDTLRGSFYLHKDNSIGLNLTEQDSKIVGAIFDFITENFKPEPAVASFVAASFFVNLSCENTELQNILSEQGLIPLQISYRLPPQSGQ